MDFQTYPSRVFVVQQRHFYYAFMRHQVWRRTVSCDHFASSENDALDFDGEEDEQLLT